MGSERLNDSDQFMDKEMKDKTVTPLRAIRAKCLECAGGKPSVVRNCESVDCSLHRFRKGHNPARTGIGPRQVSAKSIPDGILSNSPNISKENRPGMELDRVQGRTCALEQKNKEIWPIGMEAIGKVYMRDRKMVIEF